MKQAVEVIQQDAPLKAILVGLQVHRDEESFDRSMRELGGLAAACGIEVVSEITQRADHPQHATYIGSGKVEETKAAAEMTRARLAVFDAPLTPMQVRNLGRALGIEVIDRNDLILRIFSERARTKEARLQVEYARLDYLLPRLVGLRENLSRQGGASGFMSSRGAGETQLELDRRKILNRQAQLRRELKQVERVRDTQRKQRLDADVMRIGLVGYTNAGKSTLMNRLLSMSSGKTGGAEKAVFAENMLFATLDTTVRRIEIYGHKPFLISDTVGFISDLPTSLIDAFRSTLAEAAYADLLLEVIDCTDPDRKAQSEVTVSTLNDIGAGHIPRIRVMNKADLTDMQYTPSGDVPIVYISAATGAGIDALLTLIDDM